MTIERDAEATKMLLNQVQVSMPLVISNKTLTMAARRAKFDLVRHDAERAVFDLNSYVLAEHLAPEVYTATERIEFPATPWQHFKERHEGTRWLGWLVRRRPVQYDEHPVMVKVHLDRKRVYPEATVEVPELGRPVIWETITASAW